MTLTKEAIMSASDLSSRVVSVPEWGGDVRVRMLSAEEIEKFYTERHRNKTVGGMDVGMVRAGLVSMALVDDNGNRLFTDEEACNLNTKNNHVIQRLFDVVAEMNGMTEESKKAVASDFPTKG
jgi:hypothetical protein